MTNNPFVNRISEIRSVTADELRANKLNWRRHPAKQNAALKGILSEVGIAAPLIAYHNGEGQLTLIDGHLRLEQGGEWPCAILDVNDAEAKLLLSVFDPITYMAETDAAMLDSLLREIHTGDVALQALLAEMAEDAGIVPPNFLPVDESEQPRLDQKKPVTCPHCGGEFVPE